MAGQKPVSCTYDHVTLTLLEGHLVLQSGTEGVERVAAGGNLGGGEDAD